MSGTSMFATVDVLDVAADPEELDGLTDSLRRDLLDLEELRVARASDGDIPPGARGVDPESVSQLVVAVGATAPVLRQFVTTVADWWRRRQETRPGRVEIAMGDNRLVLDSATPEQQDRLIEAFLRTVGDTDR